MLQIYQRARRAELGLRLFDVLIIDHDMDLIFRLAQRITVLVQGRVLVEGPPADIGADPRVREVYLGERARA